MIENPNSWPNGSLVVVGPKGSGKSHLSRVFAHDRDVTILNAADIAAHIVPAFGEHVVVEDVEMLSPDAEETLFHLYNHQRGRGHLLLTSDRPPSRWAIALPDLASRLQSIGIVRIDDPDDKLFAALVLKQFQDRQITPSADLPAYVAARMERSHAAAAEIVARLDAVSLAEGRKITVRLAARILDNTLPQEE